MPAQGYGRKSQDWSYLTARRALYVQSALILNPNDIPVEGIIDTTVDGQGRNVERSRQQTLALFAISKSGDLSFDAVLYLWLENQWDELGCDLIQSSSSQGNCYNVGDWPDLTATRQWSLVEAAKHANADESHLGSMAFSFPWLPAGRYKAAIAIATNFTGEVIIAEQHTE